MYVTPLEEETQDLLNYDNLSYDFVKSARGRRYIRISIGSNIRVRDILLTSSTTIFPIDLTRNIYRQLGVRRVINACSTATHLGGSIPDPRVMEAMAEASEQYVIMMELQEQAGLEIAKMTVSEAALVTSGATSSLQLAAAACMMRGSGLEGFSVYPLERLQPIDGPWRDLIQRIPDPNSSKNEVVIQRGHLSPYAACF